METMIKTTYSNVDYLGQAYLTSFMNNLNGNITSLVNATEAENLYLGSLDYGMKAVAMRYFELIRFLGISYLKNPDYDYLNAPEFLEINSILEKVIRTWFDNLLSILMQTFTDFAGQTHLINVSTYIVLIISIIIIYFLVWKSFEDNLKELLKTSVDLINLIPETIKYAIVQKINEDEENKKE